jgi:hypothetical protein
VDVDRRGWGNILSGGGTKKRGQAPFLEPSGHFRIHKLRLIFQPPRLQFLGMDRDYSSLTSSSIEQVLP